MFGEFRLLILLFLFICFIHTLCGNVHFISLLCRINEMGQEWAIQSFHFNQPTYKNHSIGLHCMPLNENTRINVPNIPLLHIIYTFAFSSSSSSHCSCIQRPFFLYRFLGVLCVLLRIAYILFTLPIFVDNFKMICYVFILQSTHTYFQQILCLRSHQIIVFIGLKLYIHVVCIYILNNVCLHCCCLLLPLFSILRTYFHLPCKPHFLISLLGCLWLSVTRL